MQYGTTRTDGAARAAGWSGRMAAAVLLVGLAAGCAAPGRLTHQYARTPGAGPADGSAPLIDRLLAPAAWAPDALVAAPSFDVAALEAALHEAVNAARAEHHLPPLAWARPLADLARGHSSDMAVRAFFGHVNPAGEDATARARRAGLDPRSRVGGLLVEGVGENLFLTHRYSEYRTYPAARGGVRYEFDWKAVEDVARQAVEGWLGSRTHRANLLSPVYGAHGIGVVLGDNQTVYVTQNFAGHGAGLRTAER